MPPDRRRDRYRPCKRGLIRRAFRGRLPTPAMRTRRHQTMRPFLSLTLLFFGCDEEDQVNINDEAADLWACAQGNDEDAMRCMEDISASVSGAPESAPRSGPLALRAPMPEPLGTQNWDGTFYKWWSSRPNTILINNSGTSVWGACGGQANWRWINPGQSIACSPWGVGIVGWPPAGINVYYCTAQLQCDKAN